MATGHLSIQPDLMTIADLLSPDHVIPILRASGKEALLEELAQRASAALALDRRTVLSALLKREALGSTGVGDGIALPHARLETVVRPFVLLARLRAPIDFDAIDERPVDLVVLLILPASPQGEQLNALACVARCLRDRTVAAATRAARDAAGIYAALRGEPSINRVGA